MSAAGGHPLVMRVVLALTSLGSAALAYDAWHDGSPLARRGVVATGRVVEHHERGRDTYSVSFRTAEGLDVTVGIPLTGKPEVGEEVQVVYDPARPVSARDRNTPRPWPDVLERAMLSALSGVLAVWLRLRP